MAASNTGKLVYRAAQILDEPGSLFALRLRRLVRGGQGQRVEMQSYDIAHERIIGISLRQKPFKRFRDRAHRLVARRRAAAAKIMHGHVKRLPAFLGWLREPRLCKAFDGSEPLAK